MSRFIVSSTKKTDQTLSQSRRDNPMFRSQFLSNSVHKEIETDVRHSFFHDNTFQRVRNDLVKFKPISYEQPARVKSRSFVIIDEQVKYGQPLSAAQFEALINKKTKVHEIITYGQQFGTNLKDNTRVKIEVKKEEKEQKSGWCCCGYDKPKEKSLAEQYE